MKNYLLLLLILYPLSSYSESSGDKTILRIEVGENGFNMYSENGDFGAALCISNNLSTVNNVISFKQIDFPVSYSHLLSTALTAFIAKKTVSMWYVGCQISPWNNGDMPKPTTLVVK